MMPKVTISSGNRTLAMPEYELIVLPLRHCLSFVRSPC